MSNDMSTKSQGLYKALLLQSWVRFAFFLNGLGTGILVARLLDTHMAITHELIIPAAIAVILIITVKKALISIIEFITTRTIKS